MKTAIDLETILAPLTDDRPVGEDLRYASVYDEIKEARRADDLLDRGDWQRDIKTSDWSAVIKLASEALSTRTKDLQIAAWLTEALVNTDGFAGLATGLQILNGFLQHYWEQVYPEIEDGDLDFRAASFEFMNDKFGVYTTQIPLTDPAVNPWLFFHKMAGIPGGRLRGRHTGSLWQYGLRQSVGTRGKDSRRENLRRRFRCGRRAHFPGLV